MKPISSSTQRVPRFVRWILVLATAASAGPCAFASVVYTYTGNPFTSASGLISTTDGVTGSFTLPTAIGDDFNGEIHPSQYSFTAGDGVIFDQSTPNGGIQLNIETDGLGYIIAWYVGVYVTNAADVQTCEKGSSFTACFTTYDDVNLDTPTYPYSFGVNDNSPGTWSDTATHSAEAPEPSSLGILTIGLLALGILARKRVAA